MAVQYLHSPCLVAVVTQMNYYPCALADHAQPTVANTDRSLAAVYPYMLNISIQALLCSLK